MGIHCLFPDCFLSRVSSLLFLSFFCLCFLFSVSSSQAARSSATPRPPSPFSSPKSNNQNQQPNQQYQCNANAMQCKCSAGLPQVPPQAPPSTTTTTTTVVSALVGMGGWNGCCTSGFLRGQPGFRVPTRRAQTPDDGAPLSAPTRGDGCCIMEDIAAANKVPSRRKRGPERGAVAALHLNLIPSLPQSPSSYHQLLVWVESSARVLPPSSLVYMQISRRRGNLVAVRAAVDSERMGERTRAVQVRAS